MKLDRTPSGKRRNGTVGKTQQGGRVIVSMPRAYFPNVKNQIKVPLGVLDLPENQAIVERAIDRLQTALIEGELHNPDGTFNKVRYQEILGLLGIKPSLKLIKGGKDELPPKPKLSILEVWDIYCEFKRSSLAVTTYELMYKKAFSSCVEQAVNSVGEDPLEFRGWLLENRNKRTAKDVLSALEHAYNLVIQRDLYTGKNPFIGLSKEIEKKKRIKEIKQSDYSSEDTNLDNKDLAFTWDEAETIMSFLKNHDGKFKHHYHITAFRFLTGCRIGEACGLWWDDIKWDKECIVFRRSYAVRIKKFKPTKNETERLFPMPKNGRLWNLLKELKQGNGNECVFLSVANKPFRYNLLSNCWSKRTDTKGSKIYEYPGFIRILLEQGKISKYLPPYNTRHTFVSHQIYDLGRDRDVVNSWCEHSEEISRKHYRDTGRIAKGINPELPASNQNTLSEIEQLKNENKELREQISQLMDKLDKLIK
ncbi:MAG: site-specific integrase [Cyanobacteria bacterium J06639_18]